MARKHGQSTWLLGSHGGKARMQTDIQGIGLATRLEVGRLSVRQGRLRLLLESAFSDYRGRQRRYGRRKT